MRSRTFIIVAAAVAVAALVLLSAFACEPRRGQPQVCATYLDDDGWHEEDGELLDADPCDTDDAFEVDKVKPKPRKR